MLELALELVNLAFDKDNDSDKEADLTPEKEQNQDVENQDVVTKKWVRLDH